MEKEWPFWHDMTDNTVKMIQTINVSFYLIWNWVEVAVLVLFSYKIRNVRDELNISTELFAIVFVWISLASVYLGIASYNIGIKDGWVPEPLDTTATSKIIVQICIHSRCLLSVIISCSFCIWAVYSKQQKFITHFTTNQIEKHNSIMILYDFERVLDSVIPFKHFQLFVKNFTPQPGDENDYKGYLDIYFNLMYWYTLKKRQREFEAELKKLRMSA